MFDEDINYNDGCYCPKCETETRSRNCTGLSCDDGYIDEYEDDAINYMEGESYVRCHECHGTGIERWCPAEGCGWQWRGEKLVTDRDVIANQVTATLEITADEAPGADQEGYEVKQQNNRNA